MSSRLVLHGSVAVGFTLAVLRTPYTAAWPAWARGLLCLAAAYLPSLFDGAEYQPAPRRSSFVASRVRAAAQLLLPLVFDLRPAVLESPEALAACRQYILAQHPHGVLSLGHFLTFTSFDEALERALPQARRSAMSANVLFKIPLLRELILWLGTVDAGRAAAGRCLKAGRSLSVVPGGEREQLLAQRGPVERLVLRRRQGFVRLALQHGVPLVPVYGFGEAQLYRQFSLLRGWRSWLQRSLGVALPLPHGPWYVPGLPFAAPVRLVVGVPLEMPLLPQPSQEQIDEHHQRYIAAVERLFEQHKEACGYGEVTLEIL